LEKDFLFSKIIFIYFREFSDCAVGVLDKAFNEDNTRTFEMLDEKHPVNIKKRKVLLKNYGLLFRIGIIWQQLN